MTTFWLNVLWSMGAHLYWERDSGNLELYIMAPAPMMSILNGGARDLVKLDTPHPAGRELQCVRDMPGDRLPLAIRVGGEVDGVSTLRGCCQTRQDILPLLDRLIREREVVVDDLARRVLVAVLVGTERAVGDAAHVELLVAREQELALGACAREHMGSGLRCQRGLGARVHGVRRGKRALLGIEHRIDGDLADRGSRAGGRSRRCGEP